MEIAVAAIVLILTAPILAFMWLWIRLDSPGNPVFRQNRLARGGKLFRFTKFRTLYADAHRRFPELYAYRYEPDELDALILKCNDDPRVTRAGRRLRPSSLDELPNFWHVLTGEMALVGPRPEIPEMLPYYTDEELMKFSVRPGITGLAQCSGRGELTFREGLKLDVEYVRNRSFWLDLQIMYWTVVAVLQRRGAF
jgi:lipopolysaccharide/colanic/teichoic acid biosynthesis glycosyltransferase